MTEDPFAGLPVGEKSRSTGRTVSEGEFAVLTSLTWTTRERNANQGSWQEQRPNASWAGRVSAIVASLAAQVPLSRALRGVRDADRCGHGPRRALLCPPSGPGTRCGRTVGGQRADPATSRAGVDVARRRDQPAVRSWWRHPYAPRDARRLAQEGPSDELGTPIGTSGVRCRDRRLGSRAVRRVGLDRLRGGGDPDRFAGKVANTRRCTGSGHRRRTLSVLRRRARQEEHHPRRAHRRGRRCSWTCSPVRRAHSRIRRGRWRAGESMGRPGRGEPWPDHPEHQRLRPDRALEGESRPGPGCPGVLLGHVHHRSRRRPAGEIGSRVRRNHQRACGASSESCSP